MSNPAADESRPYREAMFYAKAEDGKTICGLCPRKCSLAPKNTGACLARRNEGGALFSLNYGRVSSINLDPIEKKPLYRFYPGGKILSAGSFGCNFSCPFCQNYTISKMVPKTFPMTPAELVQAALGARADGNIGIAFTYNEPIVWYEFVKETAELALPYNLKNVMVTNGYIEPEPLYALLPYISAMNVDLKGNEAFYNKLCGGEQRVALDTIKTAFAAGCHIEVTTLLVSGWNDGAGAVDEIARSVASVSDGIPLHLSRFFPRYRMSEAPPTDAAIVYKAVGIAKKYLKYVYPGNV